MKMLNEYLDGEHISGQFLVSSVTKGTNATGSQYLNVEIRDASTTMNAKKWEISSNDEEIIVQGNVIHIDGEVLKYKEALQIKLLSVKNVNADEIDVSKFLKQPPISREELIKKFNSYVDSVKNPDLRRIIDYFIEKYKDNLFDYPAAVCIHHEYSSGLLVHCTTMADIAEMLCKIYPVDRDLVIASILLHDFGKMTELEGPVVYKYSTKGKLIGHISIMAAEIEEAGNKLGIDNEIVTLLQHSILSHHGQLEFGSPVLPQTAEALLLSLIDNLDSKMVICLKALEETKDGEFSNKVYPLDNRTIYKHK